MACDKRCYWIFGDFHELVATAQADCNAFTIYISFPTLYFQQKACFFQASFACQALPMEPQSVAAREENPNLVLKGISSIYPGTAPANVRKAMAYKLFSYWPNPPLRWWLPALLRGNSRQKKKGASKHICHHQPIMGAVRATVHTWELNLIKTANRKSSVFWPYGRDLPCPCSCVQLRRNPCTDPQQAGGISCPTWPGNTLCSPTVELKDADSIFDLKLLMHP